MKFLNLLFLTFILNAVTAEAISESLLQSTGDAKNEFTLRVSTNTFVAQGTTIYKPWKGEARQTLYNSAIGTCRNRNLATSVVERLAWKEEPHGVYEGVWLATFKCIEAEGDVEIFHMEKAFTNASYLRVAALAKCLDELGGDAVYQDSPYHQYTRPVENPFSGGTEIFRFGAANFGCFLSSPL